MAHARSRRAPLSIPEPSPRLSARRHRRAAGLARLAALAIVGAGGGIAAAAAARPHAHRPDSGVRGDVVYGPTCPVQRPGQSCTRPYQATIKVRREPSGRLVASPRSDRAGHFSVRLAPGQYRLEPVSGHPFPHARPQQVAVRAHHFTHVVINYDSGIR